MRQLTHTWPRNRFPAAGFPGDSNGNGRCRQRVRHPQILDFFSCQSDTAATLQRDRMLSASGQLDSTTMHYNSATDLAQLAPPAAHCASGGRSYSSSNLVAPLPGGSVPTTAAVVAAAPAAATTAPIPEMLEPPPLPVPHQEDEPDPSPEEEADLGSVEEHKSVILHLLQQLKLGMDLTRVVLPTFILEKRSLLEMFADSMLHPDLFLRAADMPDPESRMIAVLEWYLTGFHAGRKNTFTPKKGALAKKPYNPLIGETFHCSWLVGAGSGQCQLVYTAEQVSHHPPVTAFYLECPQKQVWLNASIYTRSKFMGMSIGVNMIGRMQLHLMSHGEVYNLQLPSAYARSILTVPWVELGDKVAITCPKSRYSAAIVFHTKPFYGGRLHRVSAEVRNPANVVVCRVSGEWSGQLEFDYPALGVKKLLDVGQLPVTPKRVRPKRLQRPYESRRVWGAVTDALRAGDIGRATEEKRKLEDMQRACEKFRKDRNLPFPVKYFTNDEDGGWLFKRTLQKDQSDTMA